MPLWRNRAVWIRLTSPNSGAAGGAVRQLVRILHEAELGYGRRGIPVSVPSNYSANDQKIRISKSCFDHCSDYAKCPRARTSASSIPIAVLPLHLLGHSRKPVRLLAPDLLHLLPDRILEAGRLVERLHLLLHL